MAWTTFLLGRPGYEYSFLYNPKAIKIDDGQVAIDNEMLNGDMKTWVQKTSRPVVRINSDYFPLADQNTIRSMLAITDTYLSFQVRTDWTQSLEYDIPISATQVLIQNNSASRLAAALVNAGFASSITITGVFDNPAGTGTNYYTAGGGGSFSAATRTVTLGSALANIVPVYVTYTYTGWLMRMKKTPFNTEGGRVDIFQYDLTLQGV